MAIVRGPMGGAILLSGATATGAGTAVDNHAQRASFQAVGTTTAGAGSASIKIQVSDDGSNWLDLGTITLTLSTTAASDGFVLDYPWNKVRGNVSAISGTGASVSLYMGV